MKKQLLCCLSFLTIIMSGCNNNNNNNSNSYLNTSSNIILSSSVSTSYTKEVESIDVVEYADKLEYLRYYDSESIKLRVNYSDNSSKEYSGSDLFFDYSNFSSKKIGVQEINVTIKELNLSKKIEVEVIPAKTLNILMIGNSYSDDTSQWVNEICNDLGIEVNIGNLYIGGCSLETHYQNLKNDKNSYEFRHDKVLNSGWTTDPNTSIKTALNYFDWDYISLQQASALSGVESSYEYVYDVIDQVYQIKEDAQFVWNMTWAYEQDSGHSSFGTYGNSQSIMYQSIINTVKSEILSNQDILTIIPNGTAIQNARTSYVGDNLCRDVYCHLTNDFGRYIAGLMFVKSMTGIDISNIKFAPAGMNKDLIKIAIESVNNAYDKPFEVTDSLFANEPTIDLSNHIEIDYKPVGCAYWHSTAEGNYNKLMTNVDISMKFVASKRFTKEELPIGTILEIKTGYQYRPEGWIKDELQTSRPENVTTHFVEIDESWWGDYTIRAFNISSTSGNKLVDMKEAIDAFSIYVPKDTNIEIDTSLDIDDTELFKTNSLDISNYVNYKYTFQNGFYNSNGETSPEIHYVGSLATQFICTETFTKENLPIGSVLVIDDGYQYRPDAWEGNQINNNRPANVKEEFTVVDEAWWANYTVKGFNISKTNGSAVNQIPYEIVAHFRIYLPK